MTTIRKDKYVPPRVLAKYAPCVQALVMAGMVELPDPVSTKFDEAAKEAARANGDKIPMIKGDGTRWDQLPEVRSAVDELLGRAVIERGTIALVAYRHRAPYQAVRWMFNSEKAKRTRQPSQQS